MAQLSTDYAFSDVNPESRDPKQLNNPNEYKRFSGKRPSKQRFAFDLTFTEIPYIKVLELYSFLVSTGETGGIFDLPNPLPQAGSISPALTIRAVNAVGQFGQSVQLQNLPNSTSNLLLPGDYIRPTSNKKCYLVKNIVSSDASGMATVEIYPPLYNAVSGNEIIEVGDQVVFQVELESDTQDIMISAQKGKWSSPTIDVVEVG